MKMHKVKSSNIASGGLKGSVLAITFSNGTTYHYRVKSSNIASVGLKGSVLAITFSNGTTYHYSNVPAVEFDKLLKAKSVGKHFSRFIRGKFDVRQQEEQG